MEMSFTWVKDVSIVFGQSLGHTTVWLWSQATTLTRNRLKIGRRWVTNLSKLAWNKILGRSYQMGHLTWLFGCSMISSWIHYAIGQTQRHGLAKTTYIDSLTLATSAVCNVGLSPVNLGDQTQGQQGVLFLDMILGDATLVHCAICLLKLRRIRREQKKRMRPPGEDFCVEEWAQWTLIANFFAYWLLMVLVNGVALHLVGESHHYDEVLRKAQRGNISASWWAWFNVESSYSNTGLDLSNQSMIPFNNRPAVLIISALLTVAGKTLWPVFMRNQLWLLWALLKRIRPHGRLVKTLKHILDQPRKCHPLLFPWRETLILLGVQFGYFGASWLIFFALTGLPNQARFRSQFSVGQLALIGFFQSVQLRAGGMAAVSPAAVPADLGVYWGWSFIFSIYPVTTIMEFLEEAETSERAKRQGVKVKKQKMKTLHKRIYKHVKGRAIHEIPFLAICWFLIVCTEQKKDPGLDRVWPIMFEVFSAYSNNGLSMGVSNDTYSLCGSWHIFSKLVLNLVMIVGRQRTQPRTIDTSMHLEDWELINPDGHELEEMRLSPASEVSSSDTSSRETSDEEMRLSPASEVSSSDESSRETSREELRRLLIEPGHGRERRGTL